MPVYSESDLIVPALGIIAEHPGIDTSELSKKLRSQLKPTGDDLTLLANRTDDKFSQKVRNLKSHETLESKGLASFVNGKYYITKNGKKFAREAGEVSRALVDQGFSSAERQDALDKNYHGILIEEGDRALVNRTLVRRSSVLKKAALKHFADRDGSIACVGCDFRAEKIYGPTKIGMIEIHHTKPLYLGRKFRTSIEAALKDVVPLCANCHRIVHSDRSRCMPIAELKRLISANRSAASP